MYRNLFPIYIFIIFGCNSTKEISGIYKSQKPNFFFTKFTNQTKITGVSLSLNRDSTYKLLNCAMISNGKWQLSHSRILLICQSKYFLIDSFNNKLEYMKNSKCNQDTSYYNLRRNKLVKTTISNNRKFVIKLLRTN